jgi:hypothetical protein
VVKPSKRPHGVAEGGVTILNGRRDATLSRKPVRAAMRGSGDALAEDKTSRQHGDIDWCAPPPRHTAVPAHRRLEALSVEERIDPKNFRPGSPIINQGNSFSLTEMQRTFRQCSTESRVPLMETPNPQRGRISIGKRNVVDVDEDCHNPGIAAFAAGHGDLPRTPVIVQTCCLSV